MTCNCGQKKQEEKTMQEKVLKLLCENARLSIDDLALRCNTAPETIAAVIKDLENSGVICGYTVICNDQALPERNQVKALIEVKVTPRRDGGFDRIAQKIAKFPEVTDLYLLSGGYDLLLTVQGDSLQQVANFVAEKLATIDGVISTSTGFMLRKYKESGRIMQSEEEYERLKICL